MSQEKTTSPSSWRPPSPAEPPSPRSAPFKSLEGRATYTGAATGLYVIRTYTLDGDIDSRTGGQFTADAMLTATFGGGGVPANSHYSITGTIKDFVDRGGRAIDSSWTVDLEAALFGSQQGAMFEGETVGDRGRRRHTGAWSGRFFGPVSRQRRRDRATSPRSRPPWPAPSTLSSRTAPSSAPSAR